MKNAIVSSMVALSICCASSLFAGQTNTQVSPNVINLLAEGVLQVTIHTLVDHGDCTASVQFVDAEGRVFYFPMEELSLYPDNLDNLVIRIDSWDAFRWKAEIALGVATFTINGECDGVTFEDLNDNARIISEKM